MLLTVRVLRADTGSFDCVRLARHFAQDDTSNRPRPSPRSHPSASPRAGSNTEKGGNGVIRD